MADRADRADRADILHKAILEAINERHTELDMMRCEFRRGTVENQAWHKGVYAAWERFKLVKDDLRAALAGARLAAPSEVQTGAVPGEEMRHGMNCPGNAPDYYDGNGCTCGLKWRIALQTEREMHNAWRKRAEEAEAEAQMMTANASAKLDLIQRSLEFLEVNHPYSHPCVLMCRCKEKLIAEIRTFQVDIGLIVDVPAGVSARIKDGVCTVASSDGTSTTAWKCAARSANTGANDPQDCDWPTCGCEPHADKVIEVLQESGHLLARVPDHAPSGDVLAKIRAICEEGGMMTSSDTFKLAEILSDQLNRIHALTVGASATPAPSELEEAARWVMRDALYKAPEQIGEVAQRWLVRLEAALAVRQP